MDDLIWVEYKKANVSLPFPVSGTDLNIIRLAFNFFGGYLLPSEGGTPIVSPFQEIKVGRYELILIGPGPVFVTGPADRMSPSESPRDHSPLHSPKRRERSSGYRQFGKSSAGGKHADMPDEEATNLVQMTDRDNNEPEEEQNQVPSSPRQSDSTTVTTNNKQFLKAHSLRSDKNTGHLQKHKPQPAKPLPPNPSGSPQEGTDAEELPPRPHKKPPKSLLRSTVEVGEESSIGETAFEPRSLSCMLNMPPISEPNQSTNKQAAQQPNQQNKQMNKAVTLPNLAYVQKSGGIDAEGCESLMNAMNALGEDSSKRMSMASSAFQYEQLISEDDLQQRENLKMISFSNAVRSVVSKKKKRFVNEKYNLDLSYITDRIIAMGFPATKTEGIYRNSRKDVIKFLNENHKSHYKVWNLCKEPAYTYDASIFEGRVSHIPFSDHNCPTLTQMVQFCEEACDWMSQNEENVCVVHCKAGKGRTGLMIACLLIYRYADKGFDYDTAMQFYAVRRTDNAKGVTIRSQQRFIKYLETIVNQPSPPYEYIANLDKVKVSLVEMIATKANKFGKLQAFRITWGNTFYDSVEGHPQIADPDNNTLIYSEFGREIELHGEVKIEFFQGSTHPPKETLFYLWFHCGLLPATTVTWTLKQLDGKAKSVKHVKNFDPNTQLVMKFN